MSALVFERVDWEQDFPTTESCVYMLDLWHLRLVNISTSAAVFGQLP